jgi:NADH dehydrogenase (ubiquinone) Fe-S protein 4
MSLLRVGGAVRLGATRLAAPVNARFVSGPSDQVKTSDAPTTTKHGNILINKQTPTQALARHQPDYEATIDHGTSYVSSPLIPSLSPSPASSAQNP